MSARDSFIFYRSFFEATKPLKKSEKAELFDAICNYALDQKEIDLKPMAKAMFSLIQPQLQANYAKFLNGKKPKQTRSEGEANTKQTRSKSEGNVNVNDNVNDNDNDNDISASASFVFKNSLLNYGFKKELVKDFLKIRKNKKATNTETAFNQFIREIEKTKQDKNKIFEVVVASGWAGFKSEWLNTSKNGEISPHQNVVKDGDYGVL